MIYTPLDDSYTRRSVDDCRPQPRTRPLPFFRRDDAVDNLNAPAERAALRIRAAAPRGVRDARPLRGADASADPGAETAAAVDLNSIFCFFWVPNGIAAAALPRAFHAVSTRSTVPFGALSGTQPVPFARRSIATPPRRAPPLPSGENDVAALRSA